VKSQKTAFAYALAFLVVTPGLLLVAARQMPAALIPFALLAIALSLVFRNPLLRLWSQPTVRKSLVLAVVSALIVTAILEVLRPTDGPFMAFALLVALPAAVVLVIVLNRIHKRAWRVPDRR
jgi:uncharacterized membrane protein